MGKPAEADAEKTAARLLGQINAEARRRNINGASDVAAMPAAGAVFASTPAVQVAFLRAAAGLNTSRTRTCSLSSLMRRS